MPRDWPCCRRVAVSARALGRLSGAWARGGKRPCAAGSRFIDSEFVGREAVSARALIRLRPVLRTGFPSLGPFAGAPRTRPPSRRPQTCGALPLPAKPPLARLAEIAQNASRPPPYRPPPPWRAHRRARRAPDRTEHRECARDTFPPLAYRPPALRHRLDAHGPFPIHYSANGGLPLAPSPPSKAQPSQRRTASAARSPVRDSFENQNAATSAKRHPLVHA